MPTLADTTNASGVLPGSQRLSSLVAEDGTRWVDYRKTLDPRYAIVWRDILLCHVMIVLGFGSVVAIQTSLGLGLALAAAAPTTVWIGYWLHALALFGHEATHYNLASDRRRNDRLSDWFVYLYFAQATVDYRRIHGMHHSHLGDHRDTEISYHNCLSPWFLTKTLTGLYLLEVMLRYRHTSQQAEATNAGPWPTVRTLAVHAVVIVATLMMGLYAAAICWVLAVGMVFPFLMSIRQILEHRRLDATCEPDFGAVEHGPVNRIFEGGLFTRYLGAAGFHRHLLHHWDPAISYTRFDDMEAFMRRTHAASEMEASKTTYLQTFREMVSSARRGA